MLDTQMSLSLSEYEQYCDDHFSDKPRLTKPHILVNEKYDLEFVYHDWYSGETKLATYKFRRDSDDKVVVVGSPTFNPHGRKIPVPHDDVYSAVKFSVYEDEGIMGSAALFDDVGLIKLKGFSRACRELNYIQKWQQMRSTQKIIDAQAGERAAPEEPMIFKISSFIK